MMKDGEGFTNTIATDDQYYNYCKVENRETSIRQNMHNYGMDKLKQEIITLYNRICECCDQEVAELEKSEHIITFQVSSAKQLQETVARWYYNLRNLALACLLIILVYIGIRMVISSTAPEKAKYKQMIMNWVVAIGILALLHIIMVTTLTVTEKITEGLIGGCDDTLLLELPTGTKVMGANGSKKSLDVEYTDENGNKKTAPGMLTTNFVGFVRYYAGMYAGDDDNTISVKGIGYIMIYIMLVVQTCMFTWVYGKRVVYMAFLTIIAPLVAITYPIDKIGDGKSQAFDMWLKEYIFNALLQPIHLLIYTVVCGSAIDLMCKSPVYGVIALGFVVPAEKFIRKMFGFEKAQTPSALGGAAGAALAMSGIQRIGNLIRPDGKDDRDADKAPKSHRIRTASADQQQNMADSAERARNRAEGIRTADTNIQTQAGDGGNPTPPAGDGGGTPPPGDGGTPPAGDGGNPPAGDGGNPTPPAGDGGNPPPPAGDEGNPTPPAGDGGNPPPPAGDGGNPPPPPAHRGNPPTPSANLQQQNKKKPREFTSRGKRAILSMYDMQKMRIQNANTSKKWARRRRKIRRAAIGGALGFGTGLAMAATKMAMGANANDVATTAIAGGVAGYGIGSKGTQKIQEFEKMDATREAVREGWFTQEELKQQYDQEARDKAKEDRDTRAIVREACPDNWRELLYGADGEQSWFDYCYDYGLTDPEAIVAAYKYRNSAGFNEQFSGDGITEEERKAVALQVGKDIQRYGDVRNDYKKRTEMESMKRTLAMNNENLQRAAREAEARDKANQKAEAIKIKQDQAALNAEMAADVDLQAAENSAKEFERAQEAARKEIEENEAKVAAEAEELARKEAELAQLKAQVPQNSEAGVMARYNQDIAAQEAVVMMARNGEDRIREEKALEKLKAEKEEIKKKLHTENLELQSKKEALDKEIRNLKNNRTQKITDERKRELEEEVTRKREAAEAAQQTAQRIRQERYKAREESLTARRKANSQPIRSYDERLTEMADSMAKSIMKQYDQAMDQHDIVTG